ncbi:MAG: fused MFS/spermidine synthase [Deltaproteobacteria bacterium]|nr:fused MFS/spermidine synthase [Deltaproteobacteria bacterium]
MSDKNKRPPPMPEITATTRPSIPLSLSAAVFTMTIFLGAFLLFQVQPMIGKFILPWFGGSPEVWTTCLLLFQVLLLTGYAYAHVSIAYLPPRAAVIVHIILLMAALAVLPVIPAERFKPVDLDNPALQIFIMLTVTIGLPYFVLSSTGPLIQGWFSRANPHASPYWLYALSNAGSLIALLSYPFIIEPLLPRLTQVYVWSGLMVLFAALSAFCAYGLWKRPDGTGAASSPPGKPGPEPKAPSWENRLLWLALPAVATTELMAITNKICQDIAVVPFLWVLPLSLYLLSFILCFHSEKWYRRFPMFIAFVVSIAVMFYIRTHPQQMSAAAEIGFYCAGLFLCCMICHGELYRLRPPVRYLTSYYLMIAAGGALGGFFVVVLAPFLFDTFTELYLGLAACCLLFYLTQKRPQNLSTAKKAITFALALLMGFAVVFAENQFNGKWAPGVKLYRNFFGVLRVEENNYGDPMQHRLELQHGTTLHGFQFLNPQRAFLPTSYYGPQSGAGLTMQFYRKGSPRMIGVVGLGVGTLALYGQQGDVIRFYEINPDVIRLAMENFTFLRAHSAEVLLMPGDARLSMERQAPQAYDLLFLDAFSGDAVPIHLLTKEAFDLYLRHLKPEGVIALHISSIHMDLKRVIRRLAEHLNLHMVLITNPTDEARGVKSSDWVLLSRDNRFLSTPEIRSAVSLKSNEVKPASLWTDDSVNLIQILH